MLYDIVRPVLGTSKVPSQTLIWPEVHFVPEFNAQLGLLHWKLYHDCFRFLSNLKTGKLNIKISYATRESLVAKNQGNSQLSTEHWTRFITVYCLSWDKAQALILWRGRHCTMQM